MAEFDAIVIGGGPAGLTAAIYLARFHLAVGLFDDGASRAALIPLTRNLAGYPVGVGGPELLRRMRAQAAGFGVALQSETVMALLPREGGFDVVAAAATHRARTLLLATGVWNIPPPMPAAEHDDALRRGLLRYCPICDGYEVTDHAVAVLGSGAHGLAEAEFLRSYSARVTLLAPDGPHRLDALQRRRLAAWGIAAQDGPVAAISAGRTAIDVTAGGAALSFDTLYVALGSKLRSELALAAGAEAAADGAVLVDRHQMTTIPGLYAAGDVVRGLDQIASAMGQAAIAATAMRNALCAETPLRR